MLVWTITRWCTYKYRTITSRSEYLRYFPPPAREPPRYYPITVMYRECYDVKESKWVSFSSPFGLVMKPTGRYFAGKEIIEVNFAEGEWVKVGDVVKENTQNGKEDKFILDNVNTGERIELYTKYSGYGLRIGHNEFVLREPKS